MSDAGGKPGPSKSHDSNDEDSDLEDCSQILETDYKPESSEMECGCCYVDTELSVMIQCPEGHLFCQDCVQRLAKEAVDGQGKTELICMTADCGTPFSRGQLSRAVAPEVMGRLDERIQEENLNLAGLADLVRCPGCHYAAEMVDAKNKVFACPECHMRTCRHCQVDWEEHAGLACNEVEKKDETALRKAFEEKMTKAKIRFCPRCKTGIVKDGGCNKITCRCKAASCYICRKPDIDYNHFCQHVHQPGKPCRKCNRCLLWSSPEQDDERAVQEIRQEARKARQERGYDPERTVGVPQELTREDKHQSSVKELQALRDQARETMRLLEPWRDEQPAPYPFPPAFALPPPGLQARRPDPAIRRAHDQVNPRQPMFGFGEHQVNPRPPVFGFGEHQVNPRPLIFGFGEQRPFSQKRVTFQNPREAAVDNSQQLTARRTQKERTEFLKAAKERARGEYLRNVRERARTEIPPRSDNSDRAVLRKRDRTLERPYAADQTQNKDYTKTILALLDGLQNLDVQIRQKEELLYGKPRDRRVVSARSLAALREQRKTLMNDLHRYYYTALGTGDGVQPELRKQVAHALKSRAGELKPDFTMKVQTFKDDLKTMATAAIRKELYKERLTDLVTSTTAESKLKASKAQPAASEKINMSEEILTLKESTTKELSSNTGANDMATQTQSSQEADPVIARKESDAKQVIPVIVLDSSATDEKQALAELSAEVFDEDDVVDTESVLHETADKKESKKVETADKKESDKNDDWELFSDDDDDLLFPTVSTPLVVPPVKVAERSFVSTDSRSNGGNISLQDFSKRFSELKSEFEAKMSRLRNKQKEALKEFIDAQENVRLKLEMERDARYASLLGEMDSFLCENSSSLPSTALQSTLDNSGQQKPISSNTNNVNEENTASTRNSSESPTNGSLTKIAEAASASAAQVFIVQDDGTMMDIMSTPSVPKRGAGDNDTDIPSKRSRPETETA